MEKSKLIRIREEKKLPQKVIAEQMCMDISSYSRRESGQIKISLREWDKLAEILEVSVDEIYESDEKQVFMCKDNSIGINQGTNNIFPIPEHLLETQRKYIETLEKEIQALRQKLEPAKS